MAIKSTIYKAQVNVADMDRAVYADHALTLALHPSETEERLMIRVLAHALLSPPDDRRGRLESARGLSDTDEPDLWQHDLDGTLVQWVEVGQPDERRMRIAAGRAARATFFAYSASVPIWWAGIADKLARVDRLAVWQIAAVQSAELAELAARSMQLQVTVQDGLVWVGNGRQSVELAPRVLKEARA